MLKSLRTSIVLLAWLGLAGSAMAQETLGAITGTVKDASGAAVPGAAVKAVNLATNLEVSGRSDNNGSYLLPNLPAGSYRLSISKGGFQTE